MIDQIRKKIKKAIYWENIKIKNIKLVSINKQDSNRVMLPKVVVSIVRMARRQADVRRRRGGVMSRTRDIKTSPKTFNMHLSLLQFVLVEL